MYFTYEDYIDRWEELVSIFSKDAILQGSFDKFAKSAKKKRGTQEVDSEFLAEMERWREILAKNFALRNEHLIVRYLNYAIQLTIDRIIFLRMCEGWGIESYGQLRRLLEKPDIYKQLCEIYKQADDKYNSGLFHFHREKGRTTIQDGLTLDLKLDDKVLRDIIKHLYYPDSPYEFSVLPSEILGNVYEQFLGKVIRLTAGHRAKVEEKPEVKKAGGVYYTPKYIVDYIVENTVGKLCEGKTPKQIEKLRILDPACGSGSFLLGAFSYLMNWHRDLYTSQKNPQRLKDKVYQRPGQEEWFLTIKEKKRILLNNIYGVDIDSQAVEVTKLSLLLKVLEGASKEEVEGQQKLFHDRALPDLGHNIKCGNSLIGSDFYGDGVQTTLGGHKDVDKINPFDWDVEFKEIMAGGGFDAVIGNPPYGAFFGDSEKVYLKRKFDSMVGKFDSYGFFIEKGVLLLHRQGYLGFITPHTWLTVVEAKTLRRLILNSTKIEEIIRLPTKVFQKATVNTILVFFERENDISLREKNQIVVHLFPRDAQLKEISAENSKTNLFFQKDWFSTEASMFNIDVSSEEHSIITRLQKTFIPMVEICDFCVGVQAYDSYVGQDRETIKNRVFHADYQKDETFKRELNGKDVSRYFYKWPGTSWISYGDWLAHPRKPWFFKNERILVREITGLGEHSLHAAFVEEEFVNYKTILNIKLKSGNVSQEYNLRFFLGILNSNLFSWYFPRVSNKLVTKTFPRISILDMKRFPIRTIDFSNPQDKARHDRMVSLVDTMLRLHKELREAQTPHEKQLIQRQIDSTDRQIDKMVYELYDLTEEEIKIVEESVR